MDVTVKVSDWLSLIASLKRMTQYLLSYPGASLDQKHCGLHSIACKLDQIFQRALSLNLGQQDDRQPGSHAYPGLVKCLEFVRSNSQLDYEAKNFFDQFNEVTGENAVDTYLISRVLEHLVCFLQRMNDFKNFVGHSFLMDTVCVPALLSCMQALNENQPTELASLPLPCLKSDSYATMAGNDSNYDRVHNISHRLMKDDSPFLSRALANLQEEERDLDGHSATCLRKNTPTLEPQQQCFLPDVVACHTQKHSNLEWNMMHEHGQNWSSEVRADSSNPTYDSVESAGKSLQVVDESSREKYVTKEFPEKLRQLKPLDYDYASENAHLNLSELLITVIQGRKCGLSRPDLLDSSIDSSVPDTIKSYPFIEGDSLHDIAFSIQDSLCSLSSTIADCDDIYENGGSSTDEEVNDSILGDFDDSGTLLASDWFISENEAPQALLPLPKSFATENFSSISSPIESHVSLSENLREPQLRFLLQPNNSRSRSYILAVQKYRCAGCGAHAEKSCARKYRYCEFMGEYFCPDCHDNKSSRVIPAYIFHSFNFKKFKVSKIACKVLDEIFEEPVFNLRAINESLFMKQKSLARCYELRKRASDLLKKLESCPVIWDDPAHVLHSNLPLFPPHIFKSDPDFFSVHDLIKVRSGQLETLLLSFTVICDRHFQICEFCGN